MERHNGVAVKMLTCPGIDKALFMLSKSYCPYVLQRVGLQSITGFEGSELTVILSIGEGMEDL